MPLITCPDCQTQVSDQAASCPKCGRPMAPQSAAAVARTSSTVTGAALGFIVGTTLVWGGCGEFNTNVPSRELVLIVFGGVVCAILGAILGAIVRFATK